MNESFDEARDAGRRTHLANERTYLAWWRTGLTTLAVSFGAGRVVPELAGGAAWPYEAVGVAFAVVGLALIVFGYVRQKRVAAALERGDFAPLDDRPALLFALLGVVLAVATVALVVAHPD